MQDATYVDVVTTRLEETGPVQFATLLKLNKTCFTWFQLPKQLHLIVSVFSGVSKFNVLRATDKAYTTLPKSMGAAESSNPSQRQLSTAKDSRCLKPVRLQVGNLWSGWELKAILKNFVCFHDALMCRYFWTLCALSCHGYLQKQIESALVPWNKWGIYWRMCRSNTTASQAELISIYLQSAQI